MSEAKVHLEGGRKGDIKLSLPCKERWAENIKLTAEFRGNKRDGHD